MGKLSKNEALKSITMFLIDEKTEAKYQKKIATELQEYQNSMLSIATKEGLEEFIRNDENAIERLTTILGLSGERFNRVISTLRVQKGFLFTTEWSDSVLRNSLLENQTWMDEFCELLLNGRNIPQYQAIIPSFTLNYFHIDAEVIARICSDDVLGRQIKSSCSTKYNKEITYAYAKRVDDKIRSIVGTYGLHYENMLLPDGPNESLNLIHDTEKYIIVSYQYSVTTGKGQSDFADKLTNIRRMVRGNEKIKMLSLLDGAGWLVRGSDWNEVYGSCDYFLTLNTLDQLDDIIKEYYNI